MLFNSFEFLIFFTIVYVFYLVLPHRWQNWLLIVASCLFYSAWSWKFLALLFISVSTDFWCSHRIYNSKDVPTRKFFLWLSIGVNLSILGFFKYFGFFLGNLKAFLLWVFPSYSPDFSLAFNIILPVGISFYTFEAISYTVDVYRGVIPPARRYWDYALFILFFPHLIAGPIMRAKDLLSQIVSVRRCNLNQFFEGVHLIFWGLFEKIFVADNCAKIVDPFFASSAPYQGGEVLVALYAFAIQVFCDFDGYSNMARGLGKCLGFELTINFKFPYFSTNPMEFWKKWHISLSSWLRDYVYGPLRGDQNNLPKTYKNIFLTMLICGLWHGASWTYVLWGVYHGVLLIIHRWCARTRNLVTFLAERVVRSRLVKIVLFFHVIIFGLLLFRAQSIDQIIAMAGALFTNFHFRGQVLFSLAQFCFFTALLTFVQFGQWRTNDVLFLYKLAWPPKIFIYALMSYLMVVWAGINTVQFIYYQF